MGADKNSSSRRRWELQQGEHGFQHTSPTHYPSRPSPRSHCSATGPRNQQTTFRAKHTNTHSGNLHGLLPVLHRPAPVRLVTPVRLVDNTSQAGSYSSRTTSVPESLSDFSRPWNKNTPKTQPAQKENPTQNLTKQTQTNQELTSNTTAQKHTSPADHPRQIPQVARTGQIGQQHRSDRCNLGSSWWTAPAGQLLQIQTSISRIAPRTWTRLWDSRNTSWGVHSQDFVHQNLPNQEES
jgi:hypothetical protein